MSYSDSRTPSNKELFRRYIDIINANDPDRLDEVIQPDYVQVIPQSGEVVRGLEKLKALMRAWPEGDKFADSVHASHVVDEERDLLMPKAGMMPYFNVVRIDGSGDTMTGYALSTYPDGSVWYVVTMMTVRNHKVAKQLYFFAPLFDPPEWRLPFVEVVDKKDFAGVEKLLSD